MFCILLDRRNDVKMFKNQVEPRSAGEWFHYKVFNIMTSFLWSLRVHTVENCCRFVFYNDIDSLDVYFCWRFSARKRKTNCATIASFPSSVLLSNKALYHQRARNRSVIVKTSNMCFRNKSLTNLTWYLFAEEVSTLFRGTSLTTTLMDQYMKMVAIPYLQKTIGDVVAKILDCKQSCEVQYCSFTQ